MKAFNYSYAYNNPAPVAKLTLQTLDNKRTTSEVEAIIDSGADISIIPLRFLKPLKIKPEEEGYMVSQWGQRIFVGIYRVHLMIGDMKIQAIDVAGDPKGDDVILGRNVLNKLRVVLDGLGETVEIDDYS